MKPEKRRDLPYWVKPVKRIAEKVAPEKPRVDESKSGWWMVLNDSDLEEYGEIFAKQNKTIDRAFVSVRNVLNAEGQIEKTDIKRRFYLMRSGVHCQCVDEDVSFVRASVSDARPWEDDTF